MVFPCKPPWPVPCPEDHPTDRHYITRLFMRRPTNRDLQSPWVYRYIMIHINIYIYIHTYTCIYIYIVYIFCLYTTYIYIYMYFCLYLCIIYINRFLKTPWKCHDPRLSPSPDALDQDRAAQCQAEGRTAEAILAYACARQGEQVPLGAWEALGSPGKMGDILWVQNLRFKIPQIGMFFYVQYHEKKGTQFWPIAIWICELLILMYNMDIWHMRTQVYALHVHMERSWGIGHQF